LANGNCLTGNAIAIPVNITDPGEFALCAVVASPGAPNTITLLNPEEQFIISNQELVRELPPAQGNTNSISIANIGQYNSTVGFVDRSGFPVFGWAAVAPTPLFCDPPLNASLDVKLLQKTC